MEEVLHLLIVLDYRDQALIGAEIVPGMVFVDIEILERHQLDVIIIEADAGDQRVDVFA